MALSGYYGCLTEGDIDVAYNECDAALALFRGNTEEMVRLLKETPEDIPEVLGYIGYYTDALPVFIRAFPEHRTAVKEGLKKQIEELKALTPTDYVLSIQSLEDWLAQRHSELLSLESLYSQL
jgi:hypothetical protein